MPLPLGVDFSRLAATNTPLLEALKMPPPCGVEFSRLLLQGLHLRSFEDATPQGGGIFKSSAVPYTKDPAVTLGRWGDFELVERTTRGQRKRNC